MLRNVTLSAEQALIEKARARAKTERTTLNAAFRQWLESYVGGVDVESRFEEMMKDLTGVMPGGRFTRERSNER